MIIALAVVAYLAVAAVVARLLWQSLSRDTNDLTLLIVGIGGLLWPFAAFCCVSFGICWIVARIGLGFLWLVGVRR